MKLFFRKQGEGIPLIVLHGLFGSSDNWQTFAKFISQNTLAVYTVDLRNHGQSPHSSIFDYQSMSEDVLELIHEQNLSNVILLGHSLGGKTVMRLALDHPEVADKIIVADMAPRYYLPHHGVIIESLKAVDFDKVKSRGEVEKILAEKITDKNTRQFLMKGLYWKEQTKLAWRFNLETISEKIENVGEEITSVIPFKKPALFIRGEKSNYIKPTDEPQILKLFPQAKIETAPDAGHWVHADNPEWLLKACIEFLES